MDRELLTGVGRNAGFTWFGTTRETFDWPGVGVGWRAKNRSFPFNFNMEGLVFAPVI
jgi:hypothetical protein